MKAVKYFEFVRDIPFRIPLKVGEPNYCCGGKHQILYELLSSLGLKVRYNGCNFLWSDMNLPKKIEKMPHENMCSHLYLGVYVPDEKEWVDVDATWDKGLSTVFEISKWDGKSNTPIAVKAFDKESNISLIDDDISFKRDRKINGEFYKAINEWLENARKASP